MATRKTFIERKINNGIIHQDQNNSYINATQVSKMH